MLIIRIVTTSSNSIVSILLFLPTAGVAPARIWPLLADGVCVFYLASEAPRDQSLQINQPCIHIYIYIYLYILYLYIYTHIHLYYIVSFYFSAEINQPKELANTLRISISTLKLAKKPQPRSLRASQGRARRSHATASVRL